MAGAPAQFLRLYLEESRLLAQAISDADQGLRDELQDEIDRMEVSLDGR